MSETMEPTASRRLARFLITPEFVLGLRDGDVFRITQQGIPPDACRIGAGYDDVRDCFYLILESDAFAPVAEGEIIPIKESMTLAFVRSEHTLLLEDVR